MNYFRKFIRMINLFELDLNSRSYKSAFIRMLVSLLVLLGISLLRVNITLTNPALNIILSFLMLAIMIICILIFFIAAVESLQVGNNRKKDKARGEDK